MPLTFGTATPADTDGIVNLCAQCLTSAPLEFFATRLRHDPQLLPGGTLIAKEGSRVVSNVNVFSFNLIAGSATVRCAGVANVATHPDFRGRGASRTLLHEAHRLMRREGFPIATLLTGIHGFYAPLGYATWERSETHLLQLRPKATPSSPGTRKVELPKDVPALHQIRSRYCRRFIGCLDRPESVWSPNFAWAPFFPHEDPSLALVAEARGRPRAYLRASVNTAQATACIIEFGALEDSEPQIAALADAFIASALARELKAIRLPTPCRELIAALAPYATATSTSRNTTLMLNILDLAEFLQALGPELTLRAAASRTARGSILMACGGQSVCLSAEKDQVKVETVTSGENLPRAVLEPAQWTEVFTGVKPFSAQPFARQSRLDEPWINLLDALFPRRDSVFWEADTF